ncbi:hypothetical protein [Sphingobacterium deserti]|uniref:Uncharacterized protein n=1 Tax=Sphingobacterium deserti TaxID=1229276 RepID=A0A0B8T7W5_9SPHI|nr:hypothetical protein [Sphingobacterium deserti]KGE13915.1 hypothetical protein DI53_2327 [Sphingobacterium deserti]
MAGKKILFGAPTDFGFAEAIKKELELLDFDVIDVSGFVASFEYPSLWHRLRNFFQKAILQDRSYKDALRSKVVSEKMIIYIQQFDNIQHGLFIRPDLFPLPLFQKLKKKDLSISAYQWDAISRYPTVEEYIPYFNNFFAYDPSDLKRYPTVLPCTNFYLTPPHSKRRKQHGLLSINSYQADRIDITVRLKKLIDNLEVPSEFIVYTRDKKEREHCEHLGLSTIESCIKYTTNVENVLGSEVLFDAQIQSQHGLSFRVLESVGYSVKLITTNKEVSKYDFYHSDNILIFQNQSAQQLRSFLNRPYHELPASVREKYAFKNWLQYVLQLEGHTPITLP